MSEKKFNHSIKSAIASIKIENPDLITEGLEYNFHTFMEILDEENIFQEMVQQQNCYTWSKNHLQSIGLIVKEPEKLKKLSKFVSYTLHVLTHEINADTDGIVIYDVNPDNLKKEKNQKSYEHRVVTYKKNRDARTEACKQVDHVKKVRKVNKVVGGIVFVGGIVTGVFSSIALFATGTASLIPAAITCMTATPTTGACVGHRLVKIGDIKLLKIQNDNSIKKNMTKEELVRHKLSSEAT